MADRNITLDIEVNGRTARETFENTDEELEQIKRDAREAGEQVDDSMSKAAGAAEDLGDEADRAGDRIEDSMEGAQRSTRDAQDEVEELEDDMERLDRKDVDVDVDTDRDGRGDDARLPGELDEVQEAATFLGRLPPQIQVLIGAVAAAATALGLGGGLAAVATKLAAELGPAGLQNDVEEAGAVLKETGRDFAAEFEGVIRDIVLPAGRGFARLVRGLSDDAARFSRVVLGALQAAPGLIGGVSSALIQGGQQGSTEDLVNRKLREALKPLRVQLPALEQKQEADPGFGQQEALEQRVSTLEKIRDRLFDLQQQFPDVVLATEEFPEPFERVLTLLEESREELRALQQEASDQGPRGDVPVLDAAGRQNLESGDPLSGQVGSVSPLSPDAQLTAEDFKTETIEQINGAIKALDESMNDVSSKKFREQMEKAKGKLQGLKQEMKTAEDEIDLGPALIQGLEDTIATLAKAAGEGENVADALTKTLADLAIKVGNIMISLGVAALQLQPEVLLSNPAAAIAAGSALVALGAAAKQAISDEVEATTGGQSGGSRREGGGEGGVEVPGLAEGGTITQGGTVLVGEEGPELVSLPTGAAVANTDATTTLLNAIRSTPAEAFRSGRTRKVDVQQETDVNLDVDGPDIFELASQIEEANRVLDRIARQ